MKRSLLLSLIIAGTLVATTGYGQVYVHARIGLRLPAPRVYCPPVVAPGAVYENAYASPYYYQEPVYPPAVVTYGNGYAYEKYRNHDRFYAERYADRSRNHYDCENRDRHDRGWRR